MASRCANRINNSALLQRDEPKELRATLCAPGHGRSIEYAIYHGNRYLDELVGVRCVGWNSDDKRVMKQTLYSISVMRQGGRA